MTVLTIDRFEYATDADAQTAYKAYPVITGGPEAEVENYYCKVFADGGTLTDLDEINNSVITAKTNNYYNKIVGWFSGQFGWKNAGSNKVSKWYDLSPQQLDFYHTNSAMYPTWTASLKNGKAGLVFDGSDDNLIKSTTYVYSVFIAFACSSTGDSYKHLFGNNEWNIPFHGGSGSAQWIDGSPPYYLTNYVNGVAVAGSAVTKVYAYTLLDLTLPSVQPIGQICWGQNNYGGRAFPGKILEVMLLNVQCDTTLRQTIEADINTRWALY